MTSSKAQVASEKAPASRVLYRKYRPTRLADVVGQEQITSVLQNALDQGKVAHAYLFIGPRGTGKTSIARIFAHAVNGFDYQVEDHYLDIIEIDAASNTGVDNIRELREKAVIAPTKGKYKVYIIDEVHMLTKSASNALLKTLEEPPVHVIFIMATTDAHKVPITISSRTQVHTFKLATPEVMHQHLRKIADAEHIAITDGALDILVRRGGGSFRDSLSLLDQIANLTTKEITAETLEKALGLPAEQAIMELLQSYVNTDGIKIHQILKELLNTGIKPEIIASEMINHIIEQPNPSLLPLLAKLPEVQPPFPEAKLLLALLLGSNLGTITQSIGNTAPKIPATSKATEIPKTNKVTAISQKVEAPKTAKSPEKALESPQSNTTPKPPSDQALAEEPLKKPCEAPSEQIVPQNKKINSTNFDWNSFVEVINQANAALATQLKKVDYDYNQTTLHLYPTQNFVKKILEKPTNRQILMQHLDGIDLILHDIKEHKLPEDGQLSQISAIMGGIQEVKGDLPF